MTASLLISILLMYAILAGINAPAPLVGLEFDDGQTAERLWYTPPGYVIPIVWWVLFTLLGVARHTLIAERPTAPTHWLVVALAFVCAAYAWYTLGLAKLTGISALWLGLIGNLAVIALAAFVAISATQVSRTAALLIWPVVIWTSYATLIVLGEMRSARLI